MYLNMRCTKMNDHSKMDYFMWMQTQFGSGTIFSEKIRGLWLRSSWLKFRNMCGLKWLPSADHGRRRLVGRVFVRRAKKNGNGKVAGGWDLGRRSQIIQWWTLGPKRDTLTMNTMSFLMVCTGPLKVMNTSCLTIRILLFSFPSAFLHRIRHSEMHWQHSEEENTASTYAPVQRVLFGDKQFPFNIWWSCLLYRCKC